MCCFLGLKKSQTKRKPKPNQLAYSVILRKIMGRLEVLAPLKFNLKRGSAGEANYRTLCNARIQPTLLLAAEEQRDSGVWGSLLCFGGFCNYRVTGPTLSFRCDFLAHPF